MALLVSLVRIAQWAVQWVFEVVVVAAIEEFEHDLLVNTGAMELGRPDGK
ncbi:MAG: hypothetical protein AAGF11_52345 [Myxococcota bacterium]